MSLQSQAENLSRAEIKVPRRRLSVTPDFSVISAFEAGRDMAERYIAEKFRDSYGAKVTEFMPELLMMHNGALASGNLSDVSAALGMRRGTDGNQLFLEQYLSRPAEQVLADVCGEDVRRDTLVEIGNLVATQRGGSQLLFVALTILLCEQSAEWAIFTATPEVQKLLNRLHLEQHILGEADGERLGEARSNWGSYYDCCPSVMAVNAIKARRALRRHPLSALLMASCESQITQLCRYEA